LLAGEGAGRAGGEGSFTGGLLGAGFVCGSTLGRGAALELAGSIVGGVDEESIGDSGGALGGRASAALSEGAAAGDDEAVAGAGAGREGCPVRRTPAVVSPPARASAPAPMILRAAREDRRDGAGAFAQSGGVDSADSAVGVAAEATGATEAGGSLGLREATRDALSGEPPELA
jgi:hypothetical protein